MINVDDYQNLSLIAWTRAHRMIPEPEALALYKANWRSVDVANLTTGERELIERAVCDYGKGVLLV